MKDSVIAMETFIKYYVPKEWKVNISNVIFVPLYSEQDYIDMKNGIVNKKLFPYPCIKEAFDEYMRQLNEKA